MSELTIHYSFTFGDGRRIDHPVRLDEETLAPLEPLPGTPPEWTWLERHQCDGCRLDTERHPLCPAALRLIGPARHFGDVLSYERVHLRVTTREREVTAETSSQAAVSSLLGLLMATSGCPHTAFLRPMARFHLPLASEEETIYRAASMYLLAQYFRKREGRTTDLELRGLVDLYRGVAEVNRGMVQRLREASEKDSTVNAVVLLDLFTKSLPAAVDDALEELRPLFDTYLD